MRTVTDIGLRVVLPLAWVATMASAAVAAGLDETVGQLLHRDAGSAPVVPMAPPRMLPEVSMVPLMPPPPPAAAPMVTAIYGKPGDLSVVLQMDGRQLVLDQRSGRPAGSALPVRLVDISGSCARIALASRQPPTTLCVSSGFGLARRSGGMP